MKNIDQLLKIYKVGGCVRDEIMGITSNDNDYVVIGSSVDDMIKLGFIPVGKNFPVFLHPKTHEEYALARTEKKIGVGYHGFTFYTDKSVTLEEDLIRRDLTINAIAKDQNNNLIDPFGGIKDIQNKIIRHVSPAFKEDPLRALRAARFSARFNFNVDEATFKLIQELVQNKELESLASERIYLELEKALITEHAFNFFILLKDSGAIPQVLSEFNYAFSSPLNSTKFKQILELSYKYCDNLSKKYAIIYYYLSTIAPKESILQKLSEIPTRVENKALATLLIKQYTNLVKLAQLDITATYTVLKHLDFSRKPNQFNQLYDLINIIATHFDQQPNLIKNLDFCKIVNDEFKKINYQQFANQADAGEQIKQVQLHLIEKLKKQYYME